MSALRIASALLLTLAAGGCAGDPRPAGEFQMSETPNAIQLSVQKLTHMVHFAPGGIAPSPSEISSLNDFLMGSEVGRGDSIAIERNPSPVDDKRAANLVAGLARQGLKPAIRPAAALQIGEMRLEIERYVAFVPNCPNWSKAPGNDFENTLHSDFGCANATNLAAMIADPRDLAVGREPGPATGDAAIAAVHLYRTDKVKPLPSDSGNASSASPAAPSSGSQSSPPQ